MGIATHLWYAKSSIKWNLMAIETWEPAGEFTNPWQLKLLAVNPNAVMSMGHKLSKISIQWDFKHDIIGGINYFDGVRWRGSLYGDSCCIAA